MARLDDEPERFPICPFCFLAFYIISYEYILFNAFFEFKDNFDIPLVDVRLSSLNELV